MLKYPSSIIDLINSFEMLPGVGKKTAERYAFYVLDYMRVEDVEEFANNLKVVKNNIKQCVLCGNLSETDICPICQDEMRDKSVVLVVENARDVLSIEKLNEYNGVYHVLGGSISFSKGITANNLNIDSLINKVKNKEVKEIILATNATLEGETTARYIKELLSSYEDIKISRIAYGLPVGGDLLYADQMTLLKALEGRQEYK